MRGRSKVWILVAGLILTPWLMQAANVPCPLERAAAKGSNLWLLCQEEQLLISTDGGKSWQTRNLPRDLRFRSIAFVDDKRGFIVGDRGTVLASEDGGLNWRKIEVPTQENLTWIHFVGEHGWISGWNGVILHTADGGKTWVKLETGVTQGLESVYFVDPQYGWAVGWSGLIIRTRDGGKTWEKAATLMNFWSLSSVYFRDRENGWAVGFNGQILRTRDGGQTWEQLESPVRTKFTSVTFDRTGRGWITSNSELLLSEDGGQTWKVVPLNRSLFLQQALATEDRLWVVGRYGVLENTLKDGQFQALASLPSRRAEDLLGLRGRG